MEQFKKLVKEQVDREAFDSFAVASFDLDQGNIRGFQYIASSFFPIDDPIYFDIASITKLLTSAVYRLLNPSKFSNDLDLLLNHQAGLPAWGRLSKESWKDQLLSYEIKKSETAYSDFSSLRLMLELQKDVNVKDEVSKYWSNETKFWKDLSEDNKVIPTGIRNKSEIRGEPHDDNCYVINEFCTHAGMFSTAKGLVETMITIEDKIGFSDKLLRESWDNRFVMGFDTAKNKGSLAGEGHSGKVVGHLGFTGCSVWVDLKTRKGLVILSNGCNPYWYERNGLNQLRKELGSKFWSLDHS